MLSRFRRAFTLIELLVVVSILSILTLIAMPNFTLALTRAKISRARNDMRVVAGGLEIYMVDNNSYPATLSHAEGTRYFANITDVFSRGAFHYETKDSAWGIPAADADMETSHTADIGHAWLLGSIGPDQSWFNLVAFREDKYSPCAPYRDYDATNGTLSAGNIFRTNRNPELLNPPAGMYEDTYVGLPTD